MKMVEILHRYYGDFDLINEKWNEDYESILIKPKVDQEYKRCRLAKRTPKKRMILYNLLEKRSRQQEYPLYQ